MHHELQVEVFLTRDRRRPQVTMQLVRQTTPHAISHLASCLVGLMPSGVARRKAAHEAFGSLPTMPAYT
jgi:hypothetical protein